MIIYFDFNLCQIKFIKQQNEADSFAVNFLMEKAEKKDFKGIIEDFCKQNNKFLNKLKNENNFVVLPDQVVGFDSLQVPSTKFGKNKYFDNKFNLLYNQNNDLIVDSHIMTKEKNTTTFCFAMIKKDIILQVVETFKQYGIVIEGISYFSKVLSEYIFDNNKQLSKGNNIVVVYGKNILLLAISNSIIVGFQHIKQNNKQSFANKYAFFLKNTENVKSFANKNFEKEIKSMKIEKKIIDFDLPKNEIYIEQFEKYFKNSNINLKFDKLCIINSKDKLAGLNEPNTVVIKNYSEEKALLKYKKSPFYFVKRSFWK